MKHLPKFSCEVIPHKKQRYNTCGDYLKQNGKWEFKVSKLECADYEILVMIHEIVEWYLTQNLGIKEEDITYFDTHEGKDSDDPGTMKSAPYHKQHMQAMKIEKMMCKFLELDWDTYDKSFYKLQ
jgi:hypothetical protein